MATYQVKGPNGKATASRDPDDADPSDVIRQVSGAKPAPKQYDYVNGQTVPTGSPAAQAAQSPVSDSSVQNFLAGAGKATYDLGRGAGQMVGLTSRQDVADARKRDAPLMNTKAGVAGDMTGTIADLLPAAFIPGANTMAGAAAIGAGTGLMQPSTSTGETLGNTRVGRRCWTRVARVGPRRRSALSRREIGVGTAFQGRSGAHCRSYASVLRGRSGCRHPGGGKSFQSRRRAPCGAPDHCGTRRWQCWDSLNSSKRTLAE